MKKLLFVVIILISSSYLFHETILNKIGSALVKKDTIKSSDAIVVLSGDYTGTRMHAGISLLKKGMGKYIVFNGGKEYWTINYSELVLRQLHAEGIKPEQAVWSDDDKNSRNTHDEAIANLHILAEKGAKSFILVTSDYHTARAARVYEPLAQKYKMSMYVFPVQNPTVKLNNWWRDRESAKIVFIEWEKTIWYFLHPS